MIRIRIGKPAQAEGRRSGARRQMVALLSGVSPEKAGREAIPERGKTYRSSSASIFRCD